MKKSAIATAITLSLLITSTAVLAGGGKTKPKFMNFKQTQAAIALSRQNNNDLRR